MKGFIHDVVLLEHKDATNKEALISYGKESGWEVLSKGCNVVVNVHSNKVLGALSDYDECG